MKTKLRKTDNKVVSNKIKQVNTENKLNKGQTIFWWKSK